MTAPHPMTTSVTLRPRREGANMGTWIGFKHLLYLVEEATVQWFRERGYGPHRLYHDHALGLEIAEVSARFIAAVDLDDEVTAEVGVTRPGRLSVVLSLPRDNARITALRANATVVLVRDAGGRTGAAGLPDDLAQFVTDDAAPAPGPPRPEVDAPDGRDVRDVLAPPGSGVFYWPWTARYFHCHLYDRLQHSAYIRGLEELVDRFLADRGLPIGSVLRLRDWIPVVSSVRVRVFEVARVDELIHTTFAVGDIIRGRTYEGRMECHVQRRGSLVRVAAATITHGYVPAHERTVRAVEFDDEVQAALTGRTT